MIAYAMLGTNDLARARAFYDAVLGELGYGRTMDFGSSQAYGTPGKDGSVMLAVGTPHDEKPASAGNGTMVAIAAGSEAKIQAAHAKALALGGKDEGAPGPRGDSFYAAYVRDPDGNKLCFCKF
ncbi:MAG: VOC family protein [Hyphomicrobiales bacterium]|nr:VOC family protein [Hyphomicrobiales bacterium]